MSWAGRSRYRVGPGRERVGTLGYGDIWTKGERGIRGGEDREVGR